MTNFQLFSRLSKEALKDIFNKPHLAILVYLTPIIEATCRQISPLFIAILIDNFRRDSNDFSWQKYVIYFSILSLTALLASISTRYLNHIIIEYLSSERYPRFVKQALELHYDLLINTPRGELVSKIKSKAEFAKQVMLLGFNNILKILFGLIVTVIILLNRNQVYAIGYLIVWLVAAIGLIKIAATRVSVNKDANKAMESYLGIISDVVNNAEVAAQFSSQKYESNYILRKGKPLWRRHVKRWRVARKQSITIDTIQTALNLSLVVIGIWSVVNGSITIGTFVLMQTYLNFAFSDIVQIANLTRNLTEETVNAMSLDELSLKLPALTEPQKPIKPDFSNPTVEFKDVCFTYSDGKEAALKDFNLKINPREKVGLVGISGSGKSTITKLLLRMYTPVSGEIKVTGQNVEEMGSSNTRSCFAYVPQDPILFHRTIKENITYAKPNATNAEILEVAKKAHCLEFIQKLPKGFDTKVGEKGLKLSGGQRQRIAIARALLKDSPILIFDEATSALDSESESIIQETLKDALSKKTSIVIAHRLSTLRIMDRIVVIDEGRIVEDGTHEQLLDLNGIYANLWNKQSGGFLS